MLKTLSLLPFPFWVTATLLLGGVLWSWPQIRMGIGLPTIAVLGTAGAWYVGDAFYNDYDHNHVQMFTAKVLEDAWWQVAWFVAVFLILTPVLHRWMNAKECHRPGQIFRLMQTGAADPRFQSRLAQLFWGALAVWLVLVVFAFIRLGEKFPYYFFPYLAEQADPWQRGRIGHGIDALLSVGSNLQMFVAMIFGLTAALARDAKVRGLALICCFLIWPYYIFARARNIFLAVVMPAILAWVFIRLRGNWLLRLGILAACFLAIHLWFSFLIANRSQMSMTSALRSQNDKFQQAEEARHEGLNMYEELCWLNTFLADGSYRLNWGARYFADIVNPIPRSLWPGKPMIGIDYAIARGGEARGDLGDEAGVVVTVSTGMIGQGVANFGRVLGPAFAAFLMSLWAALLARLDLRGQELGNAPLYALGMILTFNLGRDITFLTLYVFFFGWALVWWVRRQHQPSGRLGRTRKKR